MNSENDFSNNLTPKYCYVLSKNIAKISPPRASRGSAKVGPWTPPVIHSARSFVRYAVFVGNFVRSNVNNLAPPISGLEINSLTHL